MSANSSRKQIVSVLLVMETIEVFKEMEQIYKYPRTRHIEGSRMNKDGLRKAEEIAVKIQVGKLSGSE